MEKTCNYNKCNYNKYILQLIIAAFIKFRRYTTLNMNEILKFSQIVGCIQNLYLFVIIAI